MSDELHAALTKAYEEQVESPVADIEMADHTSNETVDKADLQEQIDPEKEVKLESMEPDIEAPEHWASEDRDIFRSIEKKGKEFILRRHKDMEAAHTRRSQELAEERRIADNFRKTMGPHEAYLKQLNIDPLQAVDKLIATEMRLRMANPQERGALLQELARQYGAQFDPNAPQVPGIDPKTQLVLDAIKRQDERLAQIENARAEQERSSTENIIASFAHEKDETGKSKRPHFEAVRQQMGILMKEGIAKTLDEAYEQAILINADLRKEYFAKQFREEDTAKKTVASKKASLNVKGGSDATPSESTREMSLSQTIRAAIDAQLKGSRI